MRRHSILQEGKGNKGKWVFKMFYDPFQFSKVGS